MAINYYDGGQDVCWCWRVVILNTGEEKINIVKIQSVLGIHDSDHFIFHQLIQRLF